MAVVIFTTLAACGSRYPAHLNSSEQVQSIVLKHVIAQHLDGLKETATDDRLLFLSTGDPFSDPSAAVTAFVSESYRSVRPFSAAGPLQLKVREQETDRDGTVIYIAPFVLANDCPLKIEAGYHAGPLKGAHFEYQIQRLKGVWTILDQRMLKQS